MDPGNGSRSLCTINCGTSPLKGQWLLTSVMILLRHLFFKAFFIKVDSFYVFQKYFYFRNIFSDVIPDLIEFKHINILLPWNLIKISKAVYLSFQL